MDYAKAVWYFSDGLATLLAQAEDNGLTGQEIADQLQAALDDLKG